MAQFIKGTPIVILEERDSVARTEKCFALQSSSQFISQVIKSAASSPPLRSIKAEIKDLTRSKLAPSPPLYVKLKFPCLAQTGFYQTIRLTVI